jgi:type IV pilus assembly protein PilM
MSYEELATVPEPAAPLAPHASDADVWAVLENGIREISGEVRNSLDFHRSQEGGGDVSHVVLSGSAQEIPGFADALQLALGVEVRPTSVGLVDDSVALNVSPHRLAVATGLAATEVPHQ